MKCDHKTVQDVGSVTWCKRCGAVRENACLEWRLPESAQLPNNGPSMLHRTY